MALDFSDHGFESVSTDFDPAVALGQRDNADRERGPVANDRARRAGLAIDRAHVDDFGRAAADGARPVVAISRDLKAWTGLVPFVRGAHGVLELPVGTIDASGTNVGDLIEIA